MNNYNRNRKTGINNIYQFLSFSILITDVLFISFKNGINVSVLKKKKKKKKR